MWHYLKDNPNDFPPKESVLLIKVVNNPDFDDTSEYDYLQTLGKYDGCWYTDFDEILKEHKHFLDYEIVAWCDIPNVDMEKIEKVEKQLREKLLKAVNMLSEFEERWFPFYYKDHDENDIQFITMVKDFIKENKNEKE